jgi:hypothetical protein
MQMVMGRLVSHAIGLAAKYDFATRLGAGPKTAGALADAVKADRAAVYRLLRALASVGVFAETEQGVFVNTPLSEALRADVPGTVRPMAVFFGHDVHVSAWRGLEYAVETGRCAFEHIHGQAPWDMLIGNPEVAQVFNDAMTSLSGQVAHGLLEAYDFSGIDELCDLGGGHGFLLTAILARNPAMRGVLFDLPPVVAGAGKVVEASGAAARLRVVGGDFFESVPSSRAYILKSILHDWSDADCKRILASIAAASKPGAKLLLVESVIQPGNEPDFGKIIDLEMLVMTNGGRERNEREWTDLLAGAGFKLKRVIPTRSPLPVIEAVRL